MPIDTLVDIMQKPALYEKTQERFWDDPHISKGMLEAHLNPNTDAASRKPKFINRSVEWISSLLQPGTKLFDLGCGPGLYTKRFSERGFLVTGLDISERSIAYAKKEDGKSEYVIQDYLAMQYKNTFDMITLIWCDYGALTAEDRYHLLNRIHQALKPGGLFVLDVFTPTWLMKHKENTSWEVVGQGGFWSPNPHICLNAEYLYGENIHLQRHIILENKNVRCFNIWNTCFTKQSLSDELAACGFTHTNYFSDVTGTAYTEDSETLCVLVKK